MADIDTEIRVKLRRMREAFGITVQELAVLTGLKPQSISQAETGARVPTRNVVERLRTVLGIPAGVIERPWIWKTWQKAKLETFRQILSLDSKAGTFHPPASDEADVNQDGARMYRYVTFDRAALHEYLREAMNPTGPVEQLEGGRLNIALLETDVTSLDDVVLNTHPGEELLFVLEGAIDFVSLALIDDHAIERHARIGENLLTQMLANIKKQIQRHGKQDIRRPDLEVLAKWLEANQYSKTVAVEVVRVEQNTLIRYRSDWPHAAMVAKGTTKSPQMLVVASHSYPLVQFKPNATSATQ